MHSWSDLLASLTDRQWLWSAAGLYLAGFLFGTRSLWRGGKPSGALMYGTILLGYAAQLGGLYLRGRAEGCCPLGNRFEIFQFTAWSAITLYLLVGVRFRSSLLGYLTALLAAGLTLVSLAVPAWDAVRRTRIFGDNHWIEFHASLALFSYGVFGLLALTSLLFLLRHYSLKSKHLGGRFSFLPSIMDLDHISVRLLGLGVALLGISLAIGGAAWLREGATIGAAHLLVTIALWLAYAAALALRLRGRLLANRFAWACLGLFAVALLSLDLVDGSRRPATAETVQQAAP